MPPASEQEKRTFEKSKKGIIYALIVLFGNGIHPIINNSRPEDLGGLVFSFYFSFWEFLCAFIYFMILKNKQKKRNESFQAGDQLQNTKKPRIINFPLLDPKQDSRREKILILMKLLFIGSLYTIATVLYVEGLSLAGSVSGSIALKAAPIYSMGIGALFLRERVDYRLVITIIGMFFALFYIGTEGTFQIDIFSKGFAMLLLVPLLWTVGHAIAKDFMHKKIITPLTVIIIRTGIVFISLFLVTLATAGWETIQYTLFEPSHLFFSFLFGGIYFAMHISWYSSIEILDLGYASAFVNPSPIITALFALVLTDESIQQYHIVGIGVILVGLYILIYFKTHPLGRTPKETK